MYQGLLPNGTTIHDVALWLDFRSLVDRKMKTAVTTTATNNAVELHDGGSYAYNGTTSLTTVTRYPGIDAVDGLYGGATWEAWVNPTSSGESNAGTIFSKLSGGAGYSVRINGAGRTILVNLPDNTQTGQILTSAGLTASTWTHLVVTFNEDEDFALKAYYNGVLQGLTLNTASSGDAIDDSANDLIIGNNVGTTNTWNGSIGMCRIWNKPLNIAQIGQIYNRTR